MRSTYKGAFVATVCLIRRHLRPSGTSTSPLRCSLSLASRNPKPKTNSIRNSDDPDSLFDEYEDEDANDFLMQQLARMETMHGLSDDYQDDEFSFDEDDDFADLFELAVSNAQQFDDDEQTSPDGPIQSVSIELEKALMQGVVPAGAGVGSDCLPGDWGFDPLNLSTKDYIGHAQRAIWGMIALGIRTSEVEAFESGRPTALIIRDYREAEIRHGRLAMLASLFWPLQEMLDRFVLDESQFGSLLQNFFGGGVTLPFFPLLMTAIMLLLGYLDVYSQSVRDMDKIGEAFLPGDCFWDPLSVLEGAPGIMKRNMQERELFNGRMAMLAIAAYTWEEFKSHQPLINIESNQLLFEPAFAVPFIQQWLDAQFSPAFTITPEDALNLADEISSLDLLEL